MRKRNRSVGVVVEEPMNEWDGMPEFVQPKKGEFAKVILRFRTEEDLNTFAELVGQKMTPKTKSMWYPELIRGENGGKRWVHSDD